MSLVPDERTAIKVGAAALVLSLGAVVFLAVIAPRLEWSEVVRARIYYTELAGLREGAPVRSAGALIGHVESIALAPPGQPGPLSGQTGAAVHVVIDPDLLARTWRGGSYLISSVGPLSSRYIEVLPPSAGQPDERDVRDERDARYQPVREGDELRGIDPPTLDRVLQQTWTNLLIARRFLEEVAPEGRQLRAELAQLAQTVRELRSGSGSGSGSATGSGSGSATGSGSVTASSAAPEDVIDRLAAQLDELFATAELTWNDVVGGRAGLARMQALATGAAATWRNASASSAQLSALFAQLRAELLRIDLQLANAAPGSRLTALLAQARSLAAKLELAQRSLGVIQARWQRREGTLGRLLSDPEFPEDAKELGKILKRQPWRIFGHPDDSK